MRKWLSGRASPCQGEGREFKSRLPLQKNITAPAENCGCFFYAEAAVSSNFILCYNEKNRGLIISGGTMIRKFEMQDLDGIMQLWLETNISAHSFIASDYWENNYAAVKELIPNADVYIYETNGIVQGFVGLMDDYIAGIFVSGQFQSQGIGQKLLDYVKNQNSKLSLDVYKKNESAVKFYLRENFAVANEQLDDNTGEIELRMNWIR